MIVPCASTIEFMVVAKSTSSCLSSTSWPAAPGSWRPALSVVLCAQARAMKLARVGGPKAPDRFSGPSLSYANSLGLFCTRGHAGARIGPRSGNIYTHSAKNAWCGCIFSLLIRITPAGKGKPVVRRRRKATGFSKRSIRAVERRLSLRRSHRPLVRRTRL
jgi:hypothetical protein